MSSTSTSWSAQGNSKAGGTVTTTDAFTTGTLTADTLTLSSNKITFGNSEIIDNLTDEVIAFRASGSDDKMILGVVSGGAGEDCGLLLYEGTTVRWSMQHDASDDTDFALVWDYNNTTAGGATKMKLASDGDLTIAGDLTVTGADIIIGADSDGTDRTITFGHSTLKTIAGIDDSEDKFVINCAATFESTLTDNDFYLSQTAAYFAKNLYLGEDLFVLGNNINSSAGTTVLTLSGTSLTVEGQFACNGASPAAAPDWTVSNKSGTSRSLDANGNIAAIGDNLAQLVDDFIFVAPPAVVLL